MRQPGETRAFRSSRSTSIGGAKQIVIGALVALSVGVPAALRLYQGGSTNWGYLVAMSLAVVVGLALVAPERFTGEHREPGDWSKEVRALRERREARATEAESKSSSTIEGSSSSDSRSNKA